MLRSELNTVTGKMEWVVTNKDYESLDADMTEEFSRYLAFMTYNDVTICNIRSHYGDMLHDTERVTMVTKLRL